MLRKALIVALLALSPTVVAEVQPSGALIVSPSYDDDSLSVRINLASLLTAERVSRLKDGVAQRCDIGIELRRPKRIWGSTLITSSNISYIITYSIGTKALEISSSAAPGQAVQIESIASLHRYLADSISLGLDGEADFDSKSYYFLDVEVETVWLTSLNEAADGSVAENEQSELEWLFDQFLQLAGYGREHIGFQTDDFRLSDIRSE